MTNENMKNLGDTALTLQMKEELKNLEEERRKRMEEKGQRPFFQWVKGDNYFQVNPDVPMRLEQGKFGEQAIFRVKANDGKEYDLAVGKHSPLYALLVRGIAKKQFNFAIIKSGIGKETRYEEKEIEF
jgi:hypothetical protein